MKKGLISLLIILLGINIKAQEGWIKGTIIDKTTGETLIGANVLVQGTTHGTVADFNGNYSLKLNEGTYTLRVSFISYQSKLVENIKVVAGKVSHLDVQLNESGVDIQEVVVTANVSRKSESAIMTMKKKSASVMDGISMQQMSAFGVGDAASALKNVTGVSVQGGKYVFIRGLGERYTKTTLNNAEIPGLDPEKNSVQLDVFPSNVIQNISVIKSYTPDMPIEATGGLVNIVTRDFPDELIGQISTSLTYNTQSSLNKHFIGYENSSTDFLGFDNGDRAIPQLMQNTLLDMQKRNIEQISVVYYSPEELNQFTKSFNTNVYPVEKTSFLNQSYKFSLGNKVNFLGKELGFNTSLSYANNYDYYDNGNFGIYSQENSSAQKILSDRKGTHKVLISSLVNLSLKLNQNNKIGVRFLKNQSGESIARYRTGTFNYESPSTYIQERNLSYLQRGLTAVQLFGNHMFNESKINWFSSFVDMSQKEPDSRFFTNLYEKNPNGYSYKIKTNTLPARIYRNFVELNSDNHIDFEMPVHIGKKSKFKAGTAFLIKQRNADQHKFEVRSDNVTYEGTQNLDGNFQDFLTQNIISSQNPLGLYYSADANNDLINSFEAFESVYSAYAMADLAFNSQWRLIGGLRYERLSIFTHNKISQRDAKYAKGELNAHDFAPSASLVYHVNNQMNFRVALSQTVARPMFKEIAPQSFYDYKLGMRINGNPNLQEAKVQNFDFRYEYFLPENQMVAVSTFFKQFLHPIEMHLDPSSGNFEIMYVNGDRATLFGSELEVRKTFFERLRTGLNLTLVKSIVKIQPELAALRKQETRPMVGQAPYVLNAFVGYNNEDKNFDMNLTFNISGEKLLIITELQTPYIYEQPQPSLNFNLSKGLGEKFKLNFSANNILDSEYKAVYHYETEGDLYNLHYTKGRSFSLGINYQF